MRAAGAAAIAVLALGGWLAACPQVLGGIAGVVTEPEAWPIYAKIQEMQPIDRFADVLRALSGGVFATVVLAWFAWRRRSPDLGYAALCGLALLALGVWHRRFSTYDGVLGAALLAIVLSRITRSPIGADLSGAMARLGCMALVLLLPVLPDISLRLAGPKAVDTAAVVAAQNDGSDCPVRHIAALLAPYAGQVVMADMNETPELLYRTGVRTVGSLYPRAAPGALRLVRAWGAPGTTATEPAEVRATGATLVLACPGRVREGAAGATAPDTLYDRLDHNDPPPWLERVGADQGHVLYRVRGAPSLLPPGL